MPQIHDQILMLDPLPSISKVLALVVQEERQRSTTHRFPQGLESTLNLTAPTTNSIVIAPSKRKHDRPLCSHCKIQGHTVDKCYKLHGYPPGYKFKPKSTSAPP